MRRRIRRAESGESAAQRHRRIADWPRDERPREKLIAHGAHTLADIELLTILIRAGNGSASAVDIARALLSRYVTLRDIAGLSPQELMRTPGIGEAKAIECAAAFEIGRRVQSTPARERPVITSPADVAALLLPQLRDLPHEVFMVLHLDAKNGLKHQQQISIGTLNASLVHPREVYKSAIDHRAASIIVVHNHPSGNIEPSGEDLSITRQLVEVGAIVGIPLHDHIIMGGNGFLSLAERGLM